MTLPSDSVTDPSAIPTPPATSSSSQAAGAPQAVEESAKSEDKWRQGKIVKFSPQSGYGFIRDQQGKEVYFHLDEVRFVGAKNDKTWVREGLSVGIDVGRTSRGLRVTRLKIY